MSSTTDPPDVPTLDLPGTQAALKRIYDNIYMNQIMLVGYADYRQPGLYQDAVCIRKFLDELSVPAPAAPSTSTPSTGSTT